MSSAEATVDDAVVVTRVARGKDGKRAVVVLAVIAVTQLTWLGALVYGAIWLLT
jgi:hypothetical protein